MPLSAVELAVFGLNHRTAPLVVREHWAFSAEEARKALEDAQDLVSSSENLILSTCNRTEIYSLVPQTGNGGATNLQDLIDLFHRFKNIRREGNDANFYTLKKHEVVEHLFRLAGGLDSMIIGEGQILRQIRDAYDLAQQAGSVGKVFTRLFPAAMKAGKRTRSETGVAHGCITHGQAAVQLARSGLGSLDGREVLLIGSGKVTRLAAMALRDLGTRSISVTNRSMERAEALAAEIGGKAFPLGDLPCLLEVCDIAISSTGSPRPLVSASMLAGVARRRACRTLVVIDLAVPRDFDAACAQVPGVTLHNIDDLNAVIHENIEGRRSEIARAEGIVQEEVKSFLGQLNWLHLDPVIRHLIERFEAIRVAELAKFIGDVPPEHRGTVEALTSSLLKKILHFPIEKLKSLRDDVGLNPAEVTFLRRLFLADNLPSCAPKADGPPPHDQDRKPR